MRIMAIVLAAGEGRRIGGPKALLAIGAGTFLGETCRRFSEAGLDGVVAVLGAEADRVRRHVPLPEEVAVVVNERWRDGMLSSILRGLDDAEARGADAVLVHPVDNPFVTVETIAAVSAALRSGARIAVPTHGGRRGHPAGFSRAVFSALRSAPAETGARALLTDHPEWVTQVAAAADCLVDIDTREEYRTRVNRPDGL